MKKIFGFKFIVKINLYLFQITKYVISLRSNFKSLKEMSYTTEQVLTVLKKVKYPGTENDIVSQNMVEDLKIEGKKISFSLAFTKAKDPFESSIKKACVSAIITYLDEDAEIKGNISVKSPEPKQIQTQPLTLKSNVENVKNIIAIASGKGGVGKSTISTNLAVGLAKQGYKVGLIDADIFGPSLPKMFKAEGLHPKIFKANGVDMIEPIFNYGVKMLSIGFFVNPDDALVWRGPMATSALKQLITQGDWGELDYLLIDLPPGTSDIHLTLVQEVPVTGAIIVSTPQDVAIADAIKGINMFLGDKVNVPIIGLVENMAWFTPEELPNNKYYLFGKDGCKKLAEKMDIPFLSQIPIVQSIREGGDSGNPPAMDEDSIVGKAFTDLSKIVAIEVEKRNKEISPTKKVEITNTDGCAAAK